MTPPPSPSDTDPPPRSHRRLLLCSLAVPWEGAPATGLFNIHQAKALQRSGWDVQIFKPVPRVPRWLARRSTRANRWARHPTRYELDGIPVCSPAVWFSFVAPVRFTLVRLSPRLVMTWFRLAVQPTFDRHLRSFQPDAIVFHSTIPWGGLRVKMATLFIDRSGRDIKLWTSSRRRGRSLRRAVRGARGHFTSGKGLEAELRSKLPECDTRYLPNGVVEPSPEQLASSPPAEWAVRVVILCVGSFQERKGHRVLLEALASLPDAEGIKLVLVGRPPSSITQEIVRLELDQVVEVFPVMPQQELLQYMVWADLFVLPSWAEAFGNVYAEAMAAGTPVILTSDSGMAEEIEHRVHGWIVEPRSVVSLRDALLEALDADLPAMGQAGRQLVKERFSWDRNAATLNEALAHGSSSKP